MHSHSPRHLGLRNPGAQQSCSFQPSLFQFIEISSYPYRISHASKTITEIQKCHYIIQKSIIKPDSIKPQLGADAKGFAVLSDGSGTELECSYTFANSTVRGRGIFADN